MTRREYLRAFSKRPDQMERTLAYQRRPEQRAAQAARSRARWRTDPEYRKKRLEANQRYDAKLKERKVMTAQPKPPAITKPAPALLRPTVPARPKKQPIKPTPTPRPTRAGQGIDPERVAAMAGEVERLRAWFRGDAPAGSSVVEIERFVRVKR